MNSNDFVSLYSHAVPFDDEHFILKNFQIYATYDNKKGCTRIAIVNPETKHEYLIYLDYILRGENRIFEAAKALIDTNLLI